MILVALTFDLDFDHGRRSTCSECLCVTPLPHNTLLCVMIKNDYLSRLPEKLLGEYFENRCTDGVIILERLFNGVEESDLKPQS